MQRNSQHITSISSVIVILIGCMVLIGWVFNIGLLKSILPNLVSMKANTAICFILSGISLLLSIPENAKKSVKHIARGCAGLVLLIGTMSLLEYIFQWNLGIDQLFFQDAANAIGTSNPGRMAPNTALNFIFIGFALLLLDVETNRHSCPFQYLILFAGIIALFAVVGYAYGVNTLYGFAAYTKMAMHTAVTFLIICFSILFSRPHRGWMQIVLSDTSGGIIARWFFPAIILILFALGWLRLAGERAGLYDTAFGTSLRVIINILLFLPLILWTAKSLYKSDLQRKQNELQIQQLNRMLEKRINYLSKYANDIILLLDEHGKILEGNDRALKAYGYSAEELFRLNIRDLRTSEVRGQVDEQMHITDQQNGFIFETFHLRKDTTSFPVEVSARAVEIEGKKVYQNIIRDITERKKAEEQLKKTMDDLARSNRDLEQFAYVASHDLQEPLRMVSSFTQLLARRYQDKLDQDAHEFIGYAVDGANRMQRMINDLLTFSRISTRGKPFESIDCESILNEAHTNLLMAIQENQAMVTHDALPTIQADESQLILLFQNLIGNAIKFHSQGPPRIHVSTQEKENDWLFAVRDNGIGIAPEYFDRIFIIFQRLHGKEAYPGTGIGLAICKKIVERHGGKIWVESEPGKGSTFYFTIPKR
ncbi:MAG: ATP-binding protein [bacterium]